MLSPVLIFAYKRKETLQLTIESLLNCDNSGEIDVFIFCDGAKGSVDYNAVQDVRNYVQHLEGFKTITVEMSERNRGLANSIIQGVSKILESYNSIVVLEDDIIVSKNFLSFMNGALTYYDENKKVFSISGYNIPIEPVSDYAYDNYFSPRASSWGWGSWKDRWQLVDWNVNDFSKLKKDKNQIKAFNQGGSDLFKMLDKRMNGEIDSWAIRWCYSQFKHKLLTAYPTVSKVQNIGFDANATNSNVYNRYYTKLDIGTSGNFKFVPEAQLHDGFYKQFVAFYSINNRLKGRIKTLIHNLGFLPNK